MATNVSEVFQEFKIGEVEGIIKQELIQGKDPHALIKECQSQMEKIGKRFESGEYFLSELLISAKMFQKASEILSSKLIGKEDSNKKVLGKIVLGTPKGDIHDLGKNIFGLLAKVAGFEVIDIGIDVPPQKFVAMVKQEGPEIVGMSTLITTTFNSMKEVVDLLRENDLRNKVKVIIGGGATGEETRRLVGADAQTIDAAIGVRLCREFILKSS